LYVINSYINHFFIDITNIKGYFLDYNQIVNNIEWISYSQITNLEQIAEGGFSVVYKALNNGNIVAIKIFSKLQNFNKYFLNEVIIVFFNCIDYYVYCLLC